MRKAIFLDRDGVICKEKNLFYRGEPITRPEHFEWEKDSREALRELSKMDFLLVLIANQSSINQGLLNVEDFHRINQPIYEELGIYGRKLDGVYFCPHVQEEDCGCRKPEIGMVLQAKKDLDMSLDNSYMIGDKMQDIKTGLRAGCKTILVETGYNGCDNLYGVNPDFRVRNLFDATRLIKEQK